MSEERHLSTCEYDTIRKPGGKPDQITPGICQPSPTGGR
jgi:hypothetical protein